MKKFLFKSTVFLILTLVGLSFILMNYGGYVDYFYQKFTVPQQTSMILGDSRSVQGIQPRIIDQELKDSAYDLPMFNYSFTISQSNYGQPYTESVKKKLKPSHNGLFILTVNPWLFTEREDDDLKKGIYSEQKSPPHNMHFVNSNPNFEYFIRNYKYFHFRTIISQTAELHKDGWVEDHNLPNDSTTLNEWKNNQINMYKGFSKRWKKSAIRMDDFVNLITLLKKNGRVVLVRMPVDHKITVVEDDFWRSFDSEINTIAQKTKVNYFNFSKSKKYRTYDGNHIDKYSGVIFTRDLCDSIKIKR